MSKQFKDSPVSLGYFAFQSRLLAIMTGIYILAYVILVIMLLLSNLALAGFAMILGIANYVLIQGWIIRTRLDEQINHSIL